ncbi:VWA domain-containing protein [Blastopirellula sp. JC732]|uniref:VWA domain-containing protein n=1 Tax=Blastopirellula sediminis TaxID=2894196 RepID=A0A9X1MKQ3_9BACT|nr:vWA domain-containing protein [Blastopirellula sediminis]MCC9608597.1 VWA domain-containing protein [Blastopirellula sediminis]MCC9628626.1 VWA domain-containing protein [Blastopirellula sediminis]
MCIRNLKATICLLLTTTLVACLQTPGAAKEKSSGVNAGAVLSSVFDVSRSARIKSRSLMQRSFLDNVGTREQRLQIAFVIDGTDSMGQDIQGVLGSLPNMVSDLQRHKDDQTLISFGLVVYRDVNSRSGAVTLPIGGQFTSDIDVLKKALAVTATESGEPYFEEAVDLGLNDAFKSLAWDTTPGVLHWVILFGDAPPYPVGFNKNGAKRVYSDDDLIKQAKGLDATIHSILCSSGFQNNNGKNEKLKTSYETAAVKATRPFMSVLCSKTGGVFLDLSQDDVVKTMLAEAERTEVPYTKMDVITKDDLLAAKSGQKVGLEVAPVSVAVLPHTSLEKMKFDADMPEVQIATMIQEKLRLIPDLEVKDPSSVAKAYKSIASLNLNDGEAMQKLANDLRVDYVIWGEEGNQGGESQLKSSLFRRLDNQALAEAQAVGAAMQSAPPTNDTAMNSLIQTVTEKLLKSAKGELDALGVNDGMAEAYDRLDQDENMAKAFSAPLSENLRASREILSGLGQLEQALAFNLGDPQAKPYLDRAERKFGSALIYDPENAMAHAWLASAQFNLAGQDGGEKYADAYRESLEKANECKANLIYEPYQQLIEAQYSLVVAKDAARAIEVYEALLSEKTDQLELGLKSHWMLAGIYAGDWGVDMQFVDPVKSREHIVQILANWANSREAEYLKSVLRWDDEEGTRHPNLPLENYAKSNVMED